MRGKGGVKRDKFWQTSRGVQYTITSHRTFRVSLNAYNNSKKRMRPCSLSPTIPSTDNVDTAKRCTTKKSAVQKHDKKMHLQTRRIQERCAVVL